MPRKKQPKFDTIKSTDWDNILANIDKKEIPVELLETVIINLISGHSIEINIQQLLATGTNPLEIEQKINDKLHSMSDIIKDVDFHIVKEKVVKVINENTLNIITPRE